jgi:hypothetical protein
MTAAAVVIIKRLLQFGTGYWFADSNNNDGGGDDGGAYQTKETTINQ